MLSLTRCLATSYCLFKRSVKKLAFKRSSTRVAHFFVCLGFVDWLWELGKRLAVQAKARRGRFAQDCGKAGPSFQDEDDRGACQVIVRTDMTHSLVLLKS